MVIPKSLRLTVKMSHHRVFNRFWSLDTVTHQADRWSVLGREASQTENSLDSLFQGFLDWDGFSLEPTDNLLNRKGSCLAAASISEGGNCAHMTVLARILKWLFI